jgi:protein-S-isoprenylcysteine O-methyltransferase Ste14
VFFSRTLRTKRKHHVVESGPYRFVRHPGYAANLLLYVAHAVLCTEAWSAGVVILVFFMCTYYYRITVEEAMLLGRLEESYAHYMRRTDRLIPYLW